MTLLPPFPNVERVLVADLQLVAGAPTLTSGARWETGGETPPDLQAHLPFVQIRRSGGPSDVVNDYPFVQVEVLAATYTTAYDVAEDLRAYLVSPAPIRTEHGQIDRVICTSAHTEVPHDDPNVRRLVTTYRATCRRLTTVPV